MSSSSDDDDFYVSAASRLKAMKKKPLVIVSDDSPVLVRATRAHEPVTTGSNVQKPSKKSPRSLQTISQILDDEMCIDSSGNRVQCPNLQTPSATIIIEDDNDIIVENKRRDVFNISQDSPIHIEDDNYNVEVKVRWRSREVVRLQLRRYEPFEKIFQHFAKLEGVPEKQVLIINGNKTVKSNDTPASLDLKIFDYLEGGIIDADVRVEKTTEDVENICKIKVQMSTKQKINIDLKMDETFKKVVMTCAEELNVQSTQIKLSFDGEDITATDTPESLDLEQEVCIDLRVVK